MDRARWKRWLIVSVKTLVAILVIWAVGRHIMRTWADLESRQIKFEIRPSWLLVAGLLYLAGLTCLGRFYELILKASPTPIGLVPAVRAYLISHLGKYVPGKAMVVAMRAGLSVPYGARGSTAAIATFYETLVMMATGSLLSALGFAFADGSSRRQKTSPIWAGLDMSPESFAALLGLGMGLAFLVIVFPPVFRKVAKTVTLTFPRVGGESMPRLSAGLLVRGLIWSSTAWILLGASQLELAHALVPMNVEQHLRLAPVMIASVALATVAGFVIAVLPGGLGVREGVLMYALAPALGEDLAVVASLSLRLLWIVAEIVAAAVLLPLGPWYRRESSSPREAGSNCHD